MPKFLVTFGNDLAEVEAATRDDAWAAFCATRAAAMKHPNLYQRTITELVPEMWLASDAAPEFAPGTAPAPAVPVVEHVPEACPVLESEVHVEFSEPSEAESEQAVAGEMELALAQVVQSAFEAVPAEAEEN